MELIPQNQTLLNKLLLISVVFFVFVAINNTMKKIKYLS